MKKQFILSAIIALLSTGNIFAQELHKDITVEQEITPTRREAARIAILPSVSLTPLQSAALSYSSKVVTTQVPNTISTLDPVAWTDKLFTTPYRGYFDLGIGSLLYTGNISAGCKIVDNSRTKLGVWGQYNGDIYKRQHTTWHDHTASLGLNLRQAAWRDATITGALSYTYGFHDMAAVEEGRFSQSTSRLNASVELGARHQGLDYNAAIRYEHFGFYNPHIPGLKAIINGSENLMLLDPYNGYNPVRQNLIGINLGGSIESSATSRVGLDISADFLATGKHYTAAIPFDEDNMTLKRSRTTGLVAATPYFENRTSATTLSVGADVDFAINSGKKIRIAPDVTLAWHGIQYLAFELKANGGTTLNTLASLYDVSPYMNGSVAYRASHIPYAFDAKMAFGPFLGGTVELFGGYAKADDWMMPVTADIYPARGIWESLDIKGYRYGIRLGYDNGKSFAINASYEGAPSKSDRAWYNNRDRASHIINAGVRVSPIDKLSVNVNYEFRGGRACYMYNDEPDEIAGMKVYTNRRTSLGAVINLSAGATYAFTDRLSFFISGENLLGRKYSYIGGRMARNINGLIGTSLKF